MPVSLSSILKSNFGVSPFLSGDKILVSHLVAWHCWVVRVAKRTHYGDVIMDAISTQISSLTFVYSTVYSDADQGQHQSSASLAFVWGIQRGPVNSPHKWPVTQKMIPFDVVIMQIFIDRYHQTLMIRSHLIYNFIIHVIRNVIFAWKISLDAKSC